MDICPACDSKHNSNPEKKRYSFNDSKRRMALSCSKKNICIDKGNNVKTPRSFFLFQLPSFFCNKKQTLIT